MQVERNNGLGLWYFRDSGKITPKEIAWTKSLQGEMCVNIDYASDGSVVGVEVME